MTDILSEVVEIGSNYLLIDYAHGRTGLVVSYDEYLFIVASVNRNLKESIFGDLVVIKMGSPAGCVRITRAAEYYVFIEASKLTKPKI